jgi:hypothetical protein
MFCPNCKTEYRYGFTQCSDCGADLVDSLSEDHGTPFLECDPEEMVVLWAGIRDLTRQSIERALKNSNIQLESDTIDSQLMPAFRSEIYRISVRRGDYQAAVEAAKDVGAGEPIGPRSPAAVQDDNSSFLNMPGINRNLMDRSLRNETALAEEEAEDVEIDPEEEIPEPAEDEDSSTQETAPAHEVEDFYPEDATAEAWAGEDEQTRDFIQVCLRENGIPCDIVREDGKQRVMVLPADESRAKEIIREIVEGTPPK